MKRLFFLMMISFFVFAGCKKKDKTKPQTPSTTIIGTWDFDKVVEVYQEGDDVDTYTSDLLPGSYCTFNEDKTFKYKVLEDDEEETATGTYKVKDGFLYLTFVDDGEDPEIDTFTIKKLTGSELVFELVEEGESDGQPYSYENTYYLSK